MRLAFLFLIFPQILYSQEFTPPPNGIKINDSTYLDATEVANIHWLEFEYYIKNDSPSGYHESMLPLKEVTENYRPDYLRHPAYRYHPIVGITHHQALNYCKWRTVVVNLMLKKKGENYRVSYRLPNESEWEWVAKSQDSLAMIPNPNPVIYQLLRDGKRKDVRLFFPEKEIAFKELKAECRAYTKKDRTSFVLSIDQPWFFTLGERLPQETNHSMYPNNSEFKHLIGNVAEMVATPGIVKGGSWKHKLTVSFPSKQIYVDPKKAYDWVGFRCVADIISP